jgi:hypothetical protein
MPQPPSGVHRPERVPLTPVTDGGIDRELFTTYGGYRVGSTIAENLGLVGHPNLSRPVCGLDPIGRSQVATALSQLGDPAPGRTTAS